MTRVVRPATRDDVWAIHETARESWHAAYDDVLGADRVDDVVDDWYAIGDLESAITGASARQDVAFLVAEPVESAEPGERDDDTASRQRPPADDTNADADAFDRDCAGFAYAVPWPEDPSVAYLARFHVDPAVWGEGTGTTLLGRLEDVLEPSFDRLRQAVLAANDVGVSFSESAGFDRVATRENDLAADADLEEYVYERPIANADR